MSIYTNAGYAGTVLDTCIYGRQYDRHCGNIGCRCAHYGLMPVLCAYVHGHALLIVVPGRSPGISLVTRYMALVVFRKHDITKTLFIGYYCEICDVISYPSYCEMLMEFTKV